jgi:hypothetical protein
MENVAEIVVLLRKQAQLVSKIPEWHRHRNRFGAGIGGHP